MQTVAILKFTAPNDINGNGRRCYVFVHADMTTNASSVECVKDYDGNWTELCETHVLNRDWKDIPILKFNVSASEFKQIMKGALSGR